MLSLFVVGRLVKDPDRSVDEATFNLIGHLLSK